MLLGVWYSVANTITVWEIPAAFRGWAVLEWENPACPDLPHRGLTRVVAVDATGYACTANQPEAVPSGSRTFLIWPDGRREELRFGYYTYDGLQASSSFSAYSGDGSHRYEVTFIGTASEFDESNSALVRPACASPGRIKNECLR